MIMEDVPLPGAWQMTDADYLSSAPSARERDLRSKRLKKRDECWEAVHAIVGAESAQDLAPVADGLAEKIEAVAKRHSRSLPTIYSWLHRYWAGRECLNSLLPNTSFCGGPGKRRPPTTRRAGRKSRKFKAGLIESEGYVLTAVDQERLAMGYALVKPGVTVADAYRLTMGAYWSQTHQDQRGHIKHDLFPAHLRPTKVQFEYWGRLLHGTPLRRKLLGVDHWSTSTLAVSGRAQDQVQAVGQMAMIDSTSSDVYLTSMRSRQIVLPPMHRTIVVDVASTLVMGFCMSWEAPSSATSLQAILCAASDKADIAARFGIELKPDDWPGLLHRLYLADNGEMKSAALVEAEKQFRFGVEYAKAYSGQSKSLVETQHHTDHKTLDHKLPGTTRGRQRQRGETRPADEALWNYNEYMREFIVATIEHNNEEVPALAPFDMKRAGIRPSRLNVFCWMRDHGMRADISCDLGQLRAFTLPNRKAVMRRDGIHLLMENGIRLLPGHRFFAGDLTDHPVWQRAASTGRTVKLTVKLDANDLSHLWLPSDRGLLRIPNVQAEQALLEGLTLVDTNNEVESEDLRLDMAREAEDQKSLDTLIRRSEVTRNAAQEKKSEAERLQTSKKGKRVRRQSLKKNREEEMVALTFSSKASAPQLPEEESAPVANRTAEAAERAMAAFLKTVAR
ncbi:hypothetical protein ACFWZ4_12995 [Frateuria sp. GZRe12]|uniref:hypothetical protein n=1 Tax=Frateuria sp. GZRe12 TaxID=3351533 RepID=UPI003EDC4296